LRKQKNCFVKRLGYNGQGNEVWFDLFEDWGLIEASFATQYGIRLRQEEDMSWGEFITLLSGLNSKTPLGQVIAIRSENDKEILKHFTKEQHRIRNEWRSRNFKKLVTISKEEAERQIKEFQEIMRKAFAK